MSNKLNNFINLLNQDNLDISLLSDDIINKTKELLNQSNIIENAQNSNEKHLKIFTNIDNYNNLY